MREPRRFPRPSRHVTPSQKASSPEKLTRSHPPKERAASCGSRSNGCVHKAGKHVAKIPCNRNLAFTKQKNMSPFRKTYIRHPPKERAAPAARGRTVASTKQENMSRKSPATASTKQKNMSPFRKTYIRHPPKERAAPRLAVERLRPQIRKTCRENPLQPQPQPQPP